MAAEWDDEDDDLPPSVSTSLFEALSFAELLEDAAVVEALAATLIRLSRSRDLALAGTYHHYRLMLLL